MNRLNQHITDSALGLDLAQLTSHCDDMDEYDTNTIWYGRIVAYTSFCSYSRPSEPFQGGSGLCKSVLDFEYHMSRPNQVHW